MLTNVCHSALWCVFVQILIVLNESLRLSA